LSRYAKEYFDAVCPRSKAMTHETKHYIPGGVQ
jgi:hypothetical protein